MNKPTNKPLTYNRFRAYLRIKLKNKSFSKTRVFLIIAFYILCSLTLFLLPHNVLTQYPYLKYFTDFMDFIPAIKQMEIKTFAPEMCKLYASYMFVIGIVCFWFLLREFIFVLKKAVYPNKIPADKNKIAKIAANPKKFLLIWIMWDIVMIWWLWYFLSGESIGHFRYRSSNEYFIYNIYDMLFYSLHHIGFMFIVMVAITILVNFSYFDIFKRNILCKKEA